MGLNVPSRRRPFNSSVREVSNSFSSGNPLISLTLRTTSLRSMYSVSSWLCWAGFLLNFNYLSDVDSAAIMAWGSSASFVRLCNLSSVCEGFMVEQFGLQVLSCVTSFAAKKDNAHGFT